MKPSTPHLVLLPTYNTGPRLPAVVAEVLRAWPEVMVVVDGSTDGSEQAVLDLAAVQPGLKVLRLPQNSGKGAAVLAGAQHAQKLGFTHALVMDADGQHPAASVAEFMAASRQHPDCLILGRPVFPDNIPAERLYGRKLSVGLVWLELLGPGIADPLFGFRVYPLAPLLAVLGPRRGGRRYDFDSEAAVRLGWHGIKPINVSAPVRYFSRAEGGVSHFHYLRDNITQVWLHARLITELLFWRWPAVLAHRRRWRAAGFIMALCLASASLAPAAEADAWFTEKDRLELGAPNWSDLIESFAHSPDLAADFTEKRFFPFKREAVELKGEVRVSRERGLSLHYTVPEIRTVIVDAEGILLRAAAGEKAPPSDPRAAGSIEALRRVLRFDFAGLEKDFELFGQRDGKLWRLALVARTEALRRSVGRIMVAGEDATIRQIELRRSAKQAIEIFIAPPRAPHAFTDEEIRLYFR